MSWFDDLFKEYHEREPMAAMFAFGTQYEKYGLTLDDLKRDWISLGAGLLVRKDVAKEFIRRVNHDRAAVKGKLPVLQLEYVGERGMDYHTFRTKGRKPVYYADTNYTDLDKIQEEQPDLAVVSPPDWEPQFHVENAYEIDPATLATPVSAPW